VTTPPFRFIPDRTGSATKKYSLRADCLVQLGQLDDRDFDEGLRANPVFPDEGFINLRLRERNEYQSTEKNTPAIFP
jgi:hypothetical protein